MVDVTNVRNPQTLEVILAPPSAFNRLMIFTGIADVRIPSSPRDDDNVVRETAILNISIFHAKANARLFNPDVSQVAASASPSSMMGTSDADQFTWAIDSVATEIIKAPQSGWPRGSLLLKVDAASQGSGGLFQGFAYQVFAQTSAMIISDAITPPPLNVHSSDGFVPFSFTLFFSQPNPGGPVFLSSADGHDLGLPTVVEVQAADLSKVISGRIVSQEFQVGTTQITIHCETLISLFDVRFLVNVT